MIGALVTMVVVVWWGQWLAGWPGAIAAATILWVASGTVMWAILERDLSSTRFTGAVRLGWWLPRFLALGVVLAASLALGVYAAGWWGFGIVLVAWTYASGWAQARWMKDRAG